MKLIKIILNLALLMTALIGDYLVFKSKFSDSFIFRAICDSTVHGSLGFLSAAIFFSYKTNLTYQAGLYNVIFCTLISSLIDIDHFFVAKSIYLKDLTNLKQRGIFHCTTFWLLLTSALLIYSYVARKNNIYILTFMLILAFTSHHIRDANRRGLWLYPYGHTPPLNRFIYYTGLVLVPNIAAVVFSLQNNWQKDVVIQYNSLV